MVLFFYVDGLIDWMCDGSGYVVFDYGIFVEILFGIRLIEYWFCDVFDLE